MPQLRPDEIERLAHKRAGAKLGWFVHACVYLVVNLFIYGLAHWGAVSRSWTALPLLAWGLGLALHGIAVFLLGAGSGLGERLVQKERDRLQRQHDGT